MGEGVLWGKNILGKHLQNVEMTMCSICYLKENKASCYYHFWSTLHCGGLERAVRHEKENNNMFKDEKGNKNAPACR